MSIKRILNLVLSSAAALAIVFALFGYQTLSSVDAKGKPTKASTHEPNPGKKETADPCIALGTCGTGDHGKGSPKATKCKANPNGEADCTSQDPMSPTGTVIPGTTVTPNPTPTGTSNSLHSGSLSGAPGSITEGCPVVLVTGIKSGKVVFSTTYPLMTPAGQTWSFGDLRVDELRFVPSSPLFLEEANQVVNTYTWTQNNEEELRFRENSAEATCKIRFLFGSLR